MQPAPARGTRPAGAPSPTADRPVPSTPVRPATTLTLALLLVALLVAGVVQLFLLR